jgi:hypothetical protein
MDLRDLRADCGYDPRNLVTKYRRQRNEIVSGEKQVGVTQPGRSHIDENFAPGRRGDIHILEVEPTPECVYHERLHRSNLAESCQYV